MSKYKTAYAALGQERVQEGFKENEVDTDQKVTKGGMFSDAKEAYWAIRNLRNWVDMPGTLKYNRKLRRREFVEGVSQILLQLEPYVVFDPISTWRNYKIKAEEEARALAAAVNPQTQQKKEKPGKKVVLKAADKIRMENSSTIASKSLTDEITRIRNSKYSLLDIVREIKSPTARTVMMIQILKNAYDAYKKDSSNKILLFEVVWALDDIELLTKPIPKHDEKTRLMVADGSLVCEDLTKMNQLVEASRAVLAKEMDLIKLQLTLMSDRLPPLSRFTFGFKLDEWQKTVLTWIDEGKSVLICAPTSSGKTVLSSYVAAIFKSNIGDTKKDAEADPDSVMEKAPEKPAAPVLTNTMVDSDGEMVEVMDDSEEESDEDEEESEGESESGNENQKDLTNISPYLRDKINRNKFFSQKLDLSQQDVKAQAQRVLFVVPSEPLVWQVAAYFTKLLKSEGDKNTVVGIVTDQLTFSPVRQFNVMPQIVVGTPFALESALVKARGLTGIDEVHNKPAGDILAGGFDHFDWVVYDEVHSLDGVEGAALERIIRMVNCPFLALSATIGNASELKEWFQNVKGSQLKNVESINVNNFTDTVQKKNLDPLVVAKSGDTVTITVNNTMIGQSRNYVLPADASLSLLKQKILESWPHLSMDESKMGDDKYLIYLSQNGVELSDLKSVFASEDKTVTLSSVFTIWFLNASTREYKSYTVNSANITIAKLREKLCSLWRLEDTSKVQMIFKGVNLEDDQPPQSYGLFSTLIKDRQVRDKIKQRIIYFRFYSVNDFAGGSGRFINLQRYIWNPAAPRQSERLSPLSPLVGVPSVEALQAGILENSSLTFTPQDSFRVWEEISRVFPKKDVEDISPYTFFGKNERITLQRTKEYEDLLKHRLRELSFSHPNEIKKLLKSFTIEDTERKLDLCDLLLDLKDRNLLPCLPFHLNTFEAIHLFQQVIAGLEHRQKLAHPNYYTDLSSQAKKKKAATDSQIKSTGGNEKEQEEKIRSGEIDIESNVSVDEHAPHPDFTLCKSPLVDHELDILLRDMEKNDGFERRDKNSKGRNQLILKHALIRGLRRGIGLFTNEVSFSSYRRAVQKLASTGRLGVVISDDSLAFGVNMPFRTCVFCGEMRGMLDEIMAQQMSGRAGRRGLDTQGNIIYAGLRTKVVQKLMIGTLSNINGKTRESPHYVSLYLQTILSPRHTGLARTVCTGEITLKDFISNLKSGKKPEEKSADHDYIDENNYAIYSRNAMIDLGFLNGNKNDPIGYEEPAVPYALLVLVWEMRSLISQSITMGQLFPKLIKEFKPAVSGVSVKEEKKKILEKMELHIHSFFFVLLLLIDRTPYKEGGIKLKELPFLLQKSSLYEDWEGYFATQQNLLEEKGYTHLMDPVAPYAELDGTFFLCCVDRNFIHTLDDVKKQEMKKKIWQVGSIIKIMYNSSTIEDDYSRVSFFIFRNAFEKLRYLNTELIRSVVNFENVAAFERESRTISVNYVPPPESRPWSDLIDLPWYESVFKVVNKFKETKDEIKAEEKEIIAELNEAIFDYLNLNDSDYKFIVSLILEDDVAAIKAIPSTSFIKSFNQKDYKKEIKMIFLLLWFVTVYKPSMIKKFVFYLKSFYDSDIISEESIIKFHSLPYEEVLKNLPTQQNVDDSTVLCNAFTSDIFATVKKANQEFVNWLEESEEEESEEEESEEDSDEE